MWLFDKLLGTGRTGLWDQVDISPPMARAIRDWLNAFYSCPGWKDGSVRLSGLPAAITGFVATLVTSELEIHCGNSPRGTYIEEQLGPLLRRMHHAVQRSAAGGQIVIRPFVQSGRFYFDLVEPGRFFPTRFAPDDTVEAGYFADYATVEDREYIRIERFDCQGGSLTIKNEVYRSSGDVLGESVPLMTVEKWAELLPEVTISGVDRPLFGVLKMPFANTVDDTSPLPVSIYAGAMDSIMEFDRVYSEMIYELHSGKRKNILAAEAIASEAKRRKHPFGIRYTDPAADVLILDPTETKDPFSDYSPAIRTAEYMTGLKAILHMVESQCHLSPGSIAIDDRTGAITATQVISQDRTTYNTCKAIQTQGVTQGLLDVVTAMNVLCEAQGLGGAGDPEPEILYGDSIFEDTQQEFARRLQMVQAGVLRPEKLLSWYFGVDDATAEAEYLHRERGLDLFGGA